MSYKLAHWCRLIGGILQSGVLLDETRSILTPRERVNVVRDLYTMSMLLSLQSDRHPIQTAYQTLILLLASHTLVKKRTGTSQTQIMDFISEPRKWNREGIVQKIVTNKSSHGLYRGQTHLCFLYWTNYFWGKECLMAKIWKTWKFLLFTCPLLRMTVICFNLHI